MNIPQGYKQTELGIIPEDWKVVNFCEVADNFTGLTYAPENVKNYGTLVLRSSNIQDGFLCYEDNVYVDGINIPDRAKAKVGDILVCVRNGSRNLIGKSALISSKAPKGLAFGAFMTVLRAKNGAHNIFIHQIWQSDYIQRQIKDNLGATINQVTNKDINRYIIPMPPIAEQRAIAEALSDVDGLIAALDKKIAKKRLLKQGAMQQLLTGKKRLPGFTDEWVDRLLSQLGSFISGNGFPIYFQGNKSGKYPFFKVSDFNNRGNERCLMHSNNYISESTKERLNCNIVPASSVIFAKIGAAIFLERKRLSTKECCIDNNMMAFSPNEYIDANYICFLLQTISFGELVEATALPSLGAKILGSIILKVPNTLNEQQAIATILSDMDKEIADLEAQRDKYRLLKSGMMQKLLTGQIRLKTE